MAGPPFAPGATATTGVTNPARRVPSALAQLDLERVHAGAAQLQADRLARPVVGLEREGERPAAALGGGEEVEREIGLAEHRAQVPAFERGLEAGPRAHGFVRGGAHD